MSAEQRVDDDEHQAVPEVVEGPRVLTLVRPTPLPIADDHVGPVRRCRFDEITKPVRWIMKGPPDRIARALSRLVDDGPTAPR